MVHILLIRFSVSCQQRMPTLTIELVHLVVKSDLAFARIVDGPVSDRIKDRPRTAIGAKVHFLLIGKAEWSSADSAKDGDLIAGFINSPISINSLGDTQSMAFFGNMECGDQFRSWARTEA